MALSTDSPPTPESKTPIGAAVTTEPAKLLGLGDRLGTLAPGRIANLTVTRGELFSEAGQVREVWIDGERHETAKDDLEWAGTWDAGIPGFASARMTVGADSTP